MRFTKKYPKGWCVKGSDNPKWLKFCDKTDCCGNYSYYYFTRFNKNKDRKISMSYDEFNSNGKTIISVDEFFEVYENKIKEIQEEIY